MSQRDLWFWAGRVKEGDLLVYNGLGEAGCCDPYGLQVPRVYWEACWWVGCGEYQGPELKQNNNNLLRSPIHTTGLHELLFQCVDSDRHHQPARTGGNPSLKKLRVICLHVIITSWTLAQTWEGRCHPASAVICRTAVVFWRFLHSCLWTFYAVRW